MSPGSNWARGATPAASTGPVGAGVAGRVGFAAGRAEWAGDGAAAGWDLANGNVCPARAAGTYRMTSAPTAAAASIPSLRRGPGVPRPPEDDWAGGQDCPGAGPAGGQDCGGGPAGGQDCAG